MAVLRTILVVTFMFFGVLSLGASFWHMVAELDQPGEGPTYSCDNVLGLTGEARQGCAPVRQAEATSALASGVAGATWMLAALTTATLIRPDGRQQPQAPMPQAAAMGPPPQQPAPGPPQQQPRPGPPPPQSPPQSPPHQ